MPDEINKIEVTGEVIDNVTQGQEEKLDGQEKGDEGKEEDEEEEEDDDDEEEEDEEEEDDNNQTGKAKLAYIYLPASEFNIRLPSLFNASRRRTKTASDLFPHLADRLYRCLEYPHGVFINQYGELCPDDPRSGLYQLDEDEDEDEDNAPEEDEEEEKEQDDEEEEEDDDEEETKPDQAEKVWTKAENSVRVKAGMKRKNLQDDDDDYEPSSDGEDVDDMEIKDEDIEAEINDDNVGATDEDEEDWQPKKKVKQDKTKTEHKKNKDKDKKKDKDDDEEEEEDEDDDDDDEEDEDEEEEEGDDDEVQEPVEMRERVDTTNMTGEEKKSLYIKELEATAAEQERLYQLEVQRKKERVKIQKLIRQMEEWTEDWKKLCGRIHRKTKAAEKNDELRKKIKNTTICMKYDSHLMSKENPGCDFTFKKPGYSCTFNATLDCESFQINCSKCNHKTSDIPHLYDHMSSHFVEGTNDKHLKIQQP